MDKLNSLDSVQIHHIGKTVYELPKTPDSEYIVDDSCFTPMSEAIRQLSLSQNYSGSDFSAMHDFPDGKDTGIKMPINRTKDGKDIAELSTEIMNEQENIAEAIKQFKNEEAYKNEISQKYSSTSNSESNPS